MSNWHDVASGDALAEDGAMLGVAVAGQAIALFRLGADCFALEDRCSHGLARLSDGYVEDGCVECPLHQGLVDIRTGAARSAPITIDIRTFPVRERHGRIEVEL